MTPGGRRHHLRAYAQPSSIHITFLWTAMTFRRLLAALVALNQLHRAISFTHRTTIWAQSRANPRLTNAARRSVDEP